MPTELRTGWSNIYKTQTRGQAGLIFIRPERQYVANGDILDYWTTLGHYILISHHRDGHIALRVF